MSSNQEIKAATTGGQLFNLNGFLVDSTVQPIVLDYNIFGGWIYTVPVGKKLVITNIYSSLSSVRVNNSEIVSGKYNVASNSNYTVNFLRQPIFVNEGEEIKIGSTDAGVFGYLIDKDR